MLHRRTDPACIHFAGVGTVTRILGFRIPSPRRFLYERGRGKPCEACYQGRLRRADTRSSLERYYRGWTPLA